MLELNPGGPSLPPSSKKRTKPSEGSDGSLSPSEDEKAQDRTANHTPERRAEATAEPTSEASSGSSGISGTVDEVFEKAKREVDETVKSSAGRAKEFGEPVGEKGSKPATGAARPVIADAEDIEPPPPPDDMAWDEDYEEHIDGEEPPPSKPRKKRRYGGIIVLVAIILFLVIWTVFSPKIMPEVGTTYVTSQQYANLGNYTGTRDIWAGNMTWGVAIGGPSSTTVGTAINISVLVTKVSEKPGNWFFRGTAISLKNVTIFDENGTCVGTMSNWSDEGIGMMATVPVKFDQPGSYYLYAFMRFMVFMDMRIGYLPLETVQIAEAYLDVPIVVS